MIRLLICAGGTGGGVYPALSVLQALSVAVKPQQTPIDVLWVGGEAGMEVDLVKRTGIPYESIPAAGVHGVGLKSLPGNLMQLGRGVIQSRRILERYQPQAIFFTGGYVAVPMALAARLPGQAGRRARSLVYIPDIEPGWALKALVRTADHAALSTPDSESYLPKGTRRSVTGYPVRKDLKERERDRALQELGLTKDLPVFLVMGGSRGARSINQALLAGLPELLKTMQIIHSSGELDWPAVEAERESLPVDLAGRYYAFPYLHEEIGAALSAADLVLSRAGASTLGEYPLFGLPAILVPYPYAWRYQRVNADYLANKDAAVVLEDRELGVQLVPMVQSLMSDRSRRETMAKKMGDLAQPDAASKLASILITLARE